MDAFSSLETSPHRPWFPHITAEKWRLGPQNSSVLLPAGVRTGTLTRLSNSRAGQLLCAHMGLSPRMTSCECSCTHSTQWVLALAPRGGHPSLLNPEQRARLAQPGLPVRRPGGTGARQVLVWDQRWATCSGHWTSASAHLQFSQYPGGPGTCFHQISSVTFSESLPHRPLTLTAVTYAHATGYGGSHCPGMASEDPQASLGACPRSEKMPWPHTPSGRPAH